MRVKARSKRGEGNVKVRSRQHKHKLNYNLMGFDKFEINPVETIFWNTFSKSFK